MSRLEGMPCLAGFRIGVIVCRVLCFVGHAKSEVQTSSLVGFTYSIVPYVQVVSWLH